MTRPLALISAATVLLLALTGCGQKGALYLPQSDAPEQKQAQATEPASAS